MYRELHVPPYGAIAEDDPAVSGAPLTQRELDEILEKYRRFVAHEKEGVWPSFKLMDLSYLDLSGKDLRTADFTGADMRNTQLAGANLSDAIMFAVDLRQANLTHAQMDRVEADLRAGRLYNRDSHGEYRTVRDKRSLTDLAAAILTGSDLTHAKMEDALVVETDLTDANLSEVSLERADMTSSILTGSNLAGSDLSDTNKTDVILHGAVLTGAPISKVPI